MERELYHFGIKGMKWGVRKQSNKPSYHSSGFRSAMARRSNDKVDKSFKNWNANANKRADAIELGKSRNVAKRAYESDRHNKALKSEYKSANKAYKKALNQNTTYRKGQVRSEVGKDLSRKYMSDAKKVAKQMKTDPNNKALQKEYGKLMSKHDVERAKARRAPAVAANRARVKANFKRSMKVAAKSAVASAAIAGGTHVANKYLSNHQVTFNGKDFRVSSGDVQRVQNAIKLAKNIMRYM